MSAATLTALQLADSAFPTGGFAFSWGLEAALAEGRADRASLRDWLAVEVLDRWAPFDRVVLAGAWRCADTDALCVRDCDTDLLFPAEPLRLRSAEAGGALLTAAARLGDPAGLALACAVADGRAVGHLPLVQGAVFRSMGLTLELALAVSAHAAAQALATAALRLGAVGALEAQAALAALRPALAEAMVPPDPDTPPAAFAPISEIAMLRPMAGRLFVN